MMETPITLYVVDDDEALRKSSLMLLFSQGLPVQAFGSGEAFLAGTDLQKPGCVILDLRMEGMSGLTVFDTLRQVHSPLVTLFLSGHGDIPTAVEAIQQGAFDWVVKPDTQALLHKLPAAIAEARARAAAQQLWSELTPREREVARLVASGQPNKEIARLVDPPCSPRSVETHRASVFAKLHMANANELGRWLAGNAWMG
ncbi:MAG TPA: response regulator [Castellaniella sp.]|uniref:response regulator transcription factor n=1 Tax=Castellaniella sp. TaxID=1955812 RepID=UPI002EE8DBD7